MSVSNRYDYTYILMGFCDEGYMYKYTPKQNLSNDDFIKDCIEYQYKRNLDHVYEWSFITIQDAYELLIHGGAVDITGYVYREWGVAEHAVQKVYDTLRSSGYREFTTAHDMNLMLPATRKPVLPTMRNWHIVTH